MDTDHGSGQASNGAAQRGSEIERSEHTPPGLPKHWHTLQLEEQVLVHSKLHPTGAKFRNSQNLRAEWRSRGHRKGRYPLIRDKNMQYPKWNWFFVFQPGNISWWVGHLFVWGSVAWVINGFFLMWPVSSTTSNLKVTSSSAMIGGTLFEIGAVLAYWEAINVSHTSEFGEALKHTEKQFVNLPRGSRTTKEQGDWRWIGTDWHSLGFIASVVQLIAATVFWMSVIVGLPGVLQQSQTTLNYVLFWAPQVVGGSGFIISSMIIMLEEQPHWWKPQFFRMGWQVGFWNWIGGIGFTLSGIFGFWYAANKYQKWGTAFSSFWGGWAFLIGSYIQLLEAINPHPRARWEGTAPDSEEAEGSHHSSASHDAGSDA